MFLFSIELAFGGETMGFMSRRVVPACGTFCICCPSLRSRSRQPVKRYKKLIADVFQVWISFFLQLCSPIECFFFLWCTSIPPPLLQKKSHFCLLQINLHVTCVSILLEFSHIKQDRCKAQGFWYFTASEYNCPSFIERKNRQKHLKTAEKTQVHVFCFC